MTDVIELQEEVLKIKATNGDVYKMRHPNLEETLVFQKKAKDASDDEATENLISLFETLGLPRTVTMKLSLKNIKMLAELVMGDGKKK